MTWPGLLAFAGAVALTAGSPGPSVAALTSRVLQRGWRGALPFAAAMWIGEAVWFAFAALGLGTVARDLGWALWAVKAGGAIYLLYLAWSLWTASVVSGEDEFAPNRSAWRLFLAGLAVTMGNPKIMVFYLSLLPAFVDLADLSLFELAQLTTILLLTLALIDGCYIVVASKARAGLRSPRAMRISNRIGATVMAGAAVAIGVDAA